MSHLRIISFEKRGQDYNKYAPYISTCNYYNVVDYSQYVRYMSPSNALQGEKMRTSLDQMIDVAKIFSGDIKLTKDINGNYLVSIERVRSKENHLSNVKEGISGRGRNVEVACQDFMDNAKGKLLIGDDPTFYGASRPEYICV